MRIHCLIAVIACTSALAGAEPAEMEVELEREARELVMEFASRLKPELKTALQQGGPSHAVAVCAGRAPAIADSIAARSGWQVKRVSLKARNASRAMPDAWERRVLQDFDARQAAGENPQQLHHGETIGSNYRYMQAQGVEPVCLTCHGAALAQPVQDTLREYYPDDRATGYSPGQVRGAISLVKPLDP
jgi:hypothetical protein